MILEQAVLCKEQSDGIAIATLASIASEVIRQIALDEGSTSRCITRKRHPYGNPNVQSVRELTDKWLCRSYSPFQTLDMYSPVRVSIRMVSPSLTNIGT